MGNSRFTRAHASVLLALGCTALPVSAQHVEELRSTPTGLPILFTANQGQCRPEVLFQARIPGLVASLLADGLQIDLGGGGLDAGLHLRFVGASGDARAEGLEPRAARVHFLGGERALRAAPTFARVRLDGLYPGIDLEIGERDGRLEYDLFVAPGVDERALELELTGADRVTIDEAGALCAAIGGRTFRQLAPLAWQSGPDGAREVVECSWRALPGGRFGFELGARERDAELCIDPVLVYGSYIGGSNADAASAVFLDEQGAAYVTGWARSADFPHAGGGGGAARGQDVVVFKLGPDGRELLYATYLGGRDDDQGVAIRVNAEGEALVAGTTHSGDFPTTENVYDREPAGGAEAFVLKLSADGSALRFATLLGGSAEDTLAGLALGEDGEITVAGTTRSRDFPVSSWSVASARGGRDAFVARLDPLAERLLFATRLGGSDDDEGRALAVDEEGCVYLTGRTESHDFPTTLGALDRERRGVDAFVLKLSGGGRTLLYSTLLGGSQQDEGLAIAVDSRHQAVVAGWTRSLDFPFGAGTEPRGRLDGFVVRLTEMGNALVYATPLGGAGADEALGLALDPEDAAWVVGRTRSRDLVVTGDAYQARLTGAADAFLAQVSAGDGKLLYATYLGGGGEDELCAVHCDRSGTGLALGGLSTNIPSELRGTLSGKHRGPSDAFVLRLDPRSAGPVTPPGVVQSGIGLGF